MYSDLMINSAYMIILIISFLFAKEDFYMKKSMNLI